jgi:TatD DNase family protein
VVHCFTADAAALARTLELGLHVGITGWICDERRGEGLQRLVREIPAERLLLETDAPYLLPRTLRPKPRSRRNEPGWLPWVVEQVARCRDEDPREVARTSTANACTLFDLPAP